LLLILQDWIQVQTFLFQYFGQMIGLNLFPTQHGVSHADELFVMFKLHKIPMESVYTESDKATSKNLLKLWTDFAKTGNPTPDPDTTQWTRSNVTFKTYY
jgi:carboxylesterase type B